MVNGKLCWSGTWAIYVKSAVFLVDALTATPVTTVMCAGGLAQRHDTVLRYLRLLQFLRIYRLTNHVENMVAFGKSCQIRVHAGIVQIVKSVMTQALFNHWAASGWWFIHRVLERDKRYSWAVVDGLAHFDEGEHPLTLHP
jgi:hypothetical protein